MTKLPASAVSTIETWRLGFMATVSSDGKPNVSPKGTFIVVDDETIAFGEMRSPHTIANLEDNPETEVNFVDTLTRRGVRIRGIARLYTKNDTQFGDLYPAFEAIWGSDLCKMFNHIVCIPVTSVRPLQSPIYEIDGDATELKAIWQQKIANM